MKKLLIVIFLLISVFAFAGDYKPVNYIGKNAQELIIDAGCPAAMQDAGNGYMIMMYYASEEKKIRFLVKNDIVFYYDIIIATPTGDIKILERYEKPKI